MKTSPQIQINKDPFLYPIKNRMIYMNHCGTSPLYIGALQAGYEYEQAHSELGWGVTQEYPDLVDKLHAAVAKFLKTSSENISLVHNTAEGLSLIAESYPFQEGDEIISYKCEYPSNYYPWLLQERRGVKLILLENTDLSLDKNCDDGACAFSLEELESKISKRTRVIALSHVQFTSGFACDLHALGKICKAHNIDLIIDAAQSMGSLALFPEMDSISAIATSTWKWLLGPIGSGLLYTSPALREKLSYTMAGADLMKQGDDYLNHKWAPYTDARRFEYSTLNYRAAAQLLSCFEEIFNHYGIEMIQKEILELQDLLLRNINLRKYKPILFPAKNRSGILSFKLDKGNDPSEITTKAFTQKRLRLSTRGGYLRTGIHYSNSKEEILEAAEILNTLA